MPADSTQPNEKERRELRRKEQAAQQRQAAGRGKLLRWVAIIVPVVVLAAAGIWYSFKSSPSAITGDQSDIITRTGLHWHPALRITIKGQEQKIPANIGVSGMGSVIHTHDDTGQLHLEFTGLVTKEDTQLGNFFKVWGKRFDSTCIFDNCNGAGGHVSFLVNGQPNDQFDKYEMHDLDQIEIRYE